MSASLILEFGRRSRGGGWGGCSSPSFCQIFAKSSFLSQILAFLCLQPPHVPVSPRTFKFTPPSMAETLQKQLSKTPELLQMGMQ